MSTRRPHTKLTSEMYQALVAAANDAPPNAWALASVDYAKINGVRMLQLGFPQHIESEPQVLLGVPVAAVRELSKARVKDLEQLRLSPAKDTIVAETLDAYISVEGLLKDLSGASPGFAAMVARLFAARGGARSSERKQASSASNGRKGGRPKKVVEHALASKAEARSAEAKRR